MSLVGEILEIVINGYAGSYRKMRRLMISGSSRQSNRKHASESTIASTIARLKKQGLIQKNKKHLIITKRGTNYLQGLREKIFGVQRYKKEPCKNNGKTIVTFDIKEQVRHHRDWLRMKLRYLEFRPLQKSVWIGGIKLPEEFIQELNRRNILSSIHIFEVKQEGTIES